MHDDCSELKESIEKEIGFPLTFESIHKWIAFVHSKQNDILPVPNSYFGVYEDGTIKVRGIEARRHDTPVFFCKFQDEVLEIMSEGNNIKVLSKVKDIDHKYVQLLKENKVSFDELTFTKRLSRILTSIKTETPLRVMH